MAGPKAGDDDEEPAVQVPQAIMRATALSMTGDFLLFIGALFVLLGIASFLTDFLRIKGSGEFLVGGFVIVVAVVLLVRSREAMRPVPAPPKPQMEKSESYR